MNHGIAHKPFDFLKHSGNHMWQLLEHWRSLYRIFPKGFRYVLRMTFSAANITLNIINRLVFVMEM
jgi:hypothetical protein